MTNGPSEAAASGDGFGPKSLSISGIVSEKTFPINGFADPGCVSPKPIDCKPSEAGSGPVGFGRAEICGPVVDAGVLNSASNR